MREPCVMSRLATAVGVGTGEAVGRTVGLGVGARVGTADGVATGVVRGVGVVVAKLGAGDGAIVHVAAADPVGGAPVGPDDDGAAVGTPGPAQAPTRASAKAKLASG
jgi:hypothetical protein